MTARAATAARIRVPTKPSIRVARFALGHIKHPKDQFAGRPFELEEWQTECVEEVFDDLLPSGLRRKREGLVGIAKKNGKTSFAAMLGCYGTFADGRYRKVKGVWVWEPLEGAEVYNIAGSKDQAKLLFDTGKAYVERDPMLRSMVAGHIYKDAIEVPETGAVWRVMAADAKLAHGPNPSMTILDEAWVHNTPDIYEAFASAGAAREQPLMLTFTTAGIDQRSFAKNLYEGGKKNRSRSFYFHWYEMPAKAKIDDRKAWRAANPSKWVTAAFLAGELSRARRNGTESEFWRWHGNRWRSAKEMAIPMELWDTCAAKPKIPPGSDVVIGVDAAPKRDSTGILIVHRDEKGDHHWIPSIMRADPETGYLDFNELEEKIRQLCGLYNVERILTDPAYMIRTMLLLADEGLPVEEFPQGDARMVPASMNLYELLIDGRIRHGGHPGLREQVAGAGKRISERGWRFTKTGSGVIDALIAGTMASYEIERGAERDDTPQPSLYV